MMKHMYTLIVMMISISLDACQKFEVTEIFALLRRSSEFCNFTYRGPVDYAVFIGQQRKEVDSIFFRLKGAWYSTEDYLDLMFDNAEEMIVLRFSEDKKTVVEEILVEHNNRCDQILAELRESRV